MLVHWQEGQPSSPVNRASMPLRRVRSTGARERTSCAENRLETAEGIEQLVMFFWEGVLDDCLAVKVALCHEFHELFLTMTKSLENWGLDWARSASVPELSAVAFLRRAASRRLELLAPW